MELLECCSCERRLDENQKVHYADKNISGDFCNKICLSEYLIKHCDELDLEHIAEFIDFHMDEEYDAEEEEE